ncbi:MAG: hypothetical protein EPGJADBJ_04459 [Saprospiraceae bacterium]|nr:hypothetical protein [Saprospiraceae bacterium]
MTLNKRQHTLKTNALHKAKAVQDFYQEVRVEGQPDAYIWRTHIWPRFFISLPTFYRYLQMNPAKELKTLTSQATLF